MKLVFLGTRGYIDARTEKHFNHSSMKISYYETEIIIDCGEDWLEQVNGWDVDAIVLTHAHPDHAFGLKNGAPCPVYATEESWENLDDYPIEDRVIIHERQAFSIPEKSDHPVEIEAFPVLHSTRAPAVGYRIKAGNSEIFYVPDVAWIKDRKDAMTGIDIYIGDGATVKKSMVRKPGDTIIGHVPIQTQLTWCQKTGVNRAIFTHLGTQIVKGNQEEILTQIQSMAAERNIDKVEIANDQMSVILR
jgi:phosphoribosyl 1,2-cyclic phosphodiesterase